MCLSLVACAYTIFMCVCMYISLVVTIRWVDFASRSLVRHSDDEKGIISTSQ